MPVQCTCLRCGTVFSRPMAWIRKGGGRYCCRACRYARTPIAERFWPRVLCDVHTRCWYWTGATVFGYGRIGVARGTSAMLAHRLSWEINVGPIPEGMGVLHRCDVNWPPGDIGYRRCVNPDHLFLGSDQDNSWWAAAVGRSTQGERNPGARLSRGDVQQIRERRADGGSVRALAAHFGVSESTISEVVNNKRWRHIAGQPGGPGTC